MQVAPDAHLELDTILDEFIVTTDEGGEHRGGRRLDGVGRPGHDILGIAHDAVARRFGAGEQSSGTQPGDPVGLGQRVDEEHRIGVA